MNSLDFCYWLQGYFELGNKNLSDEQVKIIQDHLQLVFKKETAPINYLAASWNHISHPSC